MPRQPPQRRITQVGASQLRRGREPTPERIGQEPRNYHANAEPGGNLRPHGLPYCLIHAAQPIVIQSAVVDTCHRAPADARVRFSFATVAFAAGMTKYLMLLAAPAGAVASSSSTRCTNAR